jgi:pimeloyl-ACP methyl ester carboxylesterase
MWAPQLAAPPPGWRIIAPDLRGFGGARGRPGAANHDPAGARIAGAAGSATIDRVSSLDDYAADIVDLLDALKIREAVIGGLSLGGYVAFALLRLARHYFRALILADTRSTADTDAGRAARVKMQALAGEEGPTGVAREMLPKLVSEATQRERPEIVAFVRGLIESSDAPAIQQALGAMMTRPDSTPLLAQIHQSTLVIVGERDGLTPVADSEAMHRRVPGSILSIIPEAGHLSNLEAPQEFNDAVGQFLARRV